MSWVDILSVITLIGSVVAIGVAISAKRKAREAIRESEDALRMIKEELRP